MKRFISAITLVLVCTPVFAIDTAPTQTLLWNHFKSLVVVDSFLIAAHSDGITCLKRNPQAGTYEIVNYLLLPTEPVELKCQDSVIVIRDKADVLTLLDIAVIPSLTVSQQIDPGMSFEDFSLHAGHLYLSMGFQGVWRFNTDPNPRFMDSSMLGIHVTKGIAIDNYLYALDDYNGVIRYTVNQDGSLTYDDFLYVPLQVTDIAISDSTLVLSTERGKAYLARCSDSVWIVDTVATIDADQVIITGSHALLTNSSHWMASSINLATGDEFRSTFFSPPQHTFNGDVVHIESVPRVIFPMTDGGIAHFDITKPLFAENPQNVYLHRGPVTRLILESEFLVTAGRRNPLDVFRYAGQGDVQHLTTLRPGITDVSDVALEAGNLFAYFTRSEELVSFTRTPDGFVEQGSLELEGSGINRIEFLGSRYDTTVVLGLVASQNLYIYNGNITALEQVEHLRLVGSIVDVLVVDSLLLVSTTKRDIQVFRLYSDFRAEYRSTLFTSQVATSLIKLNVPHEQFSNYSVVRVFACVGSELRQLVLTRPDEPHFGATYQLPTAPKAAVVTGNTFYTIGDNGVFKYQSFPNMLTVVDSGGRPGDCIAVRGSLLATSDGHAVHLFRDSSGSIEPIEPNKPTVALSNYPNPFNPSTTITFALESPSRVALTVYNMLGQEVIQLLNRTIDAGTHRVNWNGATASGHPAASGLYIYRLVTENGEESRKMVLLR